MCDVAHWSPELTLQGHPASPPCCADYFVRFHFTQFLKLYHNPDRDHQATFLCRKHMATLLVLAQAGGDAGPHVRHRFLQLSVVDFFVRELALEFEVNQPGVATMHRSDSSFSDVGPVSTSGGPKSGAGARFARIGSWKASPAGSARDSPLVGQQPGSQGRHKRGLSLTGNDLLEGNQPTPSPRVPKLRLPGSGDKLGGGDAPSSPALSPGSVSSGAAGRPSSRFGSPRVTSRIGREAATQAANAAAAASSSSQDTTERPAVPKLGLGALGLSLESPDAEAPSNPQSVTSGDGRISAAASVPPLQLAGGQGRPHPPGLALPPRPLERFISAAISLDAEWPASGRAGPSDSKEETLEEESEEVEASEEHGTGSRRRGGRRRWPSGSSVGSLPTGFAFTGDLDADVELLEALEQHVRWVLRSLLNVFSRLSLGESSTF